MANMQVKDGASATKYLKSAGVGTDLDPFVPKFALDAAVDTELTTADLDTGGGTDTRAVVGMVLAASGGGVLVGAANPMPVSDNGGSLTVDGTVAATQSGTWNVGTVSAVTAVGTVTTVSAVTTVTTVTTVGTVTAVTAITNALPTGANTIGAVNLAQYTPASGRLPTDGSGVTQPTKEVRAATATAINVASSASSVTLLNANSNRLGAYFYNNSTQTLYLKCGATASSSSFTHLLPTQTGFTLPANYTGQVDGIWASANGTCQGAEFTA